MEIFRVGVVYVAMWDEDAGIIRLPFYSHDGKRESYPPFPFGNGLTSHVLRSRESLNIGEDLASKAAGPWADDPFPGGRP